MSSDAAEDLGGVFLLIASAINRRRAIVGRLRARVPVVRARRRLDRRSRIALPPRLRQRSQAAEQIGADNQSSPRLLRGPSSPASTYRFGARKETLYRAAHGA